MIKHTQTIRRQKPADCLSVFDHFMGLSRRGLNSMTAKLQHQISGFQLSKIPLLSFRAFMKALRNIPKGGVKLFQILLFHLYLRKLVNNLVTYI